MNGVAASMRHRVLATRPVRKVIGLPQVVSVGKRVAPRTDMALHRLTKGKVSLINLCGAPSLVLHTVGRKSGLPRTTPLMCGRTDGGFLVIGSNWGQSGHPGWALNLRTDPQASIEVRGRRRPVTARLLEGDERAEAWRVMSGIWPPFDDYTERSGRELMVFLLRTSD